MAMAGSGTPIRLVIRNYDQITPILAGDVEPDGIELTIDRNAAISEFLTTDHFDAGEMSFSGHVRRLAEGDNSVIGLPVFIMRGFRHRCFFVGRDSGLTSFTDLAGRRIGTNGWPDSGNTWSRALLRAAGVSLSDIEWTVGTIDGITDQKFGHRVSAANMPEGVTVLPEGETLQEKLLAGELDAMMVPWPPVECREPDGAIVRLLPDYRAAEQEYSQKVGYWPAHHLIGVRADAVERDPDVVKNLFEMFDQSRQLMEERRWALTDTTPWLLTDLTETVSVLGDGWQAYGVESNQPMVRAFCTELHQQGILSQPVDPEIVFADFQRLMDER